MTTLAGAREQRIKERAYALWQAHQGAEQGPEAFWHQAETEVREEEASYDGTVEDSFPASDPPANSGIT